jgi:hypothetical protein
MRPSGVPSLLRLVATAAAGWMLLTGLSGCARGAHVYDAAGSCADVIEYDGHTYVGVGHLRRDPEVSGASMSAVRPACDDVGGVGGGRKDEAIRVVTLTGVDPDAAVFFQGNVYLRRGRELPAWTQQWFQAPRCDSAGILELHGRWLGVTSPLKPRFDGDLRLPYRLDVYVTSGPEGYVGAMIVVQATEATDPALTPADVKQTLGQGGSVSASVRCADGRFEALALRAG